MSAERPSPFTIPEPKFKFCEGPGAEPIKPYSLTVGLLIRNLTAFATFYEDLTQAIERAPTAMKPAHFGDREANADAYRRQFQAARGIDRIRAYVFANYGDDLTIGTARQLLGALVRIHKMPMPEAESLTLEAAMDRLDAPVKRPRRPGPAKPPTPQKQLAALLQRLAEEGKLRLSIGAVHDFMQGEDSESKAVRQLVDAIKKATTKRGTGGKPRTDTLVIGAALTDLRRPKKSTN